MAKFREIQKTIMAFQWTGKTLEDAKMLCKAMHIKHFSINQDGELKIESPIGETEIVVSQGDWIVEKDNKNALPCDVARFCVKKNEDFVRKYEEIA